MKKGGQRVIGEINITPLTDIFLVLMIIMMVVTPLLDFAGLQTSKASDGDAGEGTKTDAFAIEIPRDGPYRLDGADISEDALRDAIIAKKSEKSGGVFLKVLDADAPLHRLSKAMEACQAAGVTGISVYGSDGKLPEEVVPEKAPEKAKPKPGKKKAS